MKCNTYIFRQSGDTSEGGSHGGNDEELRDIVRQAAEYIASVVSRHESNATTLASVIEVKVETTILHNHTGMLYKRHTFQEDK